MLRDTHGPDFASRFGLGFSAIDREENIRRIGAVAQLFCEAGLIALTAFILSLIHISEPTRPY